jgi:hypothetical protein
LTLAKKLLGSAGVVGEGQILVATDGSTSTETFKWVGDNAGTNYAEPTLDSSAYSVAVAHDMSAVVFGIAGTPRVNAFPFTYSGGYGTKFSDPSTLPAGDTRAVHFTTDSSYVALGHQNSPYISVYPWSGSGFGTKISNPATLPTNWVYGIKWSPDDSEIVCAHGGSPYITAYPWTGSAFGTKRSDPASLPSSGGTGVCWESDGSHVFMSTAGSPYIVAYPYSSGFGTKISNPGTLPTGYGRCINIAPDDSAVAVGHDNTPYITAYPWTGSAFGTKYSNPSSLPVASVMGVSWSPDGGRIFCMVNHTSDEYRNYAWSSGFGSNSVVSGFSMITGTGLAFGSTAGRVD